MYYNGNLNLGYVSIMILLYIILVYMDIHYALRVQTPFQTVFGVVFWGLNTFSESIWMNP